MLGFPVKGEATGDGRVKIVTVPGHTVISTEYSKDRESAYEELVNYVEENELDVIGAPRRSTMKRQGSAVPSGPVTPPFSGALAVSPCFPQRSP